jgi:acyl-CoA synthetase (AMP-forming)/AMP-acid ligase II
MRLAGALVERGVRPGDAVASFALDGIEMIDLWYASAILGSVRTGINWRYAPREVEHILRDANVRLILVETGPPTEALEKLSGSQGPDTIRFGGARDRYEAMLADAEPWGPDSWYEVTPTDPIAISYTTGSTGLPKGAIWSQGAVVDAQLHTWLDAGGRRDDVYLHCIPAAGVPVLLATWNCFVGSTIVLQDRFDPGKALELMQTEQVTAVLLIPTMIADILNHPDFDNFDLSSLRLIIYGSAPTTTTLVKRVIDSFACELQQWYGSTEGAGGWFTILRHEDHLRALDGPGELLKSCGNPMTHVQLRTVSEDGNVCGPGEVGEVCVKSSTLMNGYVGLQKETADTLRDGWLHTGDLGYLDADNFLYLVDRKKFMIISGGYNIYPVVVEHVLSEHPAIAEVCVVGVPDERWGEVVCAAIVVEPSEIVTAGDVIAFCKARLASFEVPKHVVFTESMPRGATGKLLKREVKDRLTAEISPSNVPT